MTYQTSQMYEFGPFRVDPAERIISRDGNAISMTGKAFDALLFLIQRSGHLIEKGELIHAVWPDSFVEEGNLKVVIWALRKSLDDDVGEPKYIQTVAKHGYRFVGEVRSVTKAEAELPSARTSSILPVDEPRRQIKLNLAVKAGILALGILGVVAILIRLVKPFSSGVDEAGIHSMAVLPFEPLNLDADKKYLGLGIADAVITRLGSTGQMIVRPTSSIAKYALSPADPLEIGREQKVDSVLDGKIEILSDHVRVSVQLVRVRDGFLMWADTFTKSPEQILLWKRRWRKES
jgi:DNA-binding winged helix-turn-helix (wHTH) protein/TolB-like protein